MNLTARIIRGPTRLSGGHPAGHVDQPQHRPTDMEVTTSDGVRLSVRDYGRPSAHHTVVFLHGLCLTGAAWSGQIDYLLRRYGDSIRVISYDHRGHGRSSGASVDTYRIDQLASDLADVLTALSISGPLTLVGHSMGGMTALAYLARPSVDRPVDPQGLVLAATAAGKLAQRGLGRLLATPATAALAALVNHAPKQVLNALVEPVCSTLGRMCGRAPARTMVAALGRALVGAPLATAVGFLPALSRHDAHRTLGRIRARTVVISGGADVLTPHSHSLDLVGAIPGAAHVHLPDAGHMLPHEVPHVINDAIRQAMFPDGIERKSYHRAQSPAGGERRQRWLAAKRYAVNRKQESAECGSASDKFVSSRKGA